MMAINYDYCQHGEYIEDNGSLICRICGLVIKEENLVVQFERVYDHIDVERVIHHDVPTESFVPRRTIFKPKDMRFVSGNKEKYIRMNKVDKWSNKGDVNKAVKIKNTILTYLEYIGISGNKVVLKKMNYIIQIVRGFNIQGKSIEMFSAALLIYILRSVRIPCNIKKLMRFYDLRKMMKILGLLDVVIKKFDLPEMEELRLRDYVVWYLNKVSNEKNIIPEDKMLLTNNGIYYADLMDEYSIGKSDLCNASGIIYFILKNDGFRINQEEIAEIIEVTSVSLRRAVDDLKELISLYDDE